MSALTVKIADAEKALLNMDIEFKEDRKRLKMIAALQAVNDLEEENNGPMSIVDLIGPMKEIIQRYTEGLDES
jgi:hypothetical protein